VGEPKKIFSGKIRFPPPPHPLSRKKRNTKNGATKGKGTPGGWKKPCAKTQTERVPRGGKNGGEEGHGKKKNGTGNQKSHGKASKWV